MKILINRLWPALLLFVTTATVMAQKKDSLLLISHGMLVQPDSIQLISKGIHVNADSIHIGRGTLKVADGKIYHFSSDTMPERKTRVLSDSIYKKKNTFYTKTKVFHVQKDSLFYKKDSTARKLVRTLKDSVLRKQDVRVRKTRSLQLKQDSLRKLQKTYQTKTTLHRLDSLRSLNWKKDSARIKVRLETLKYNLKRLKQDTAQQKNNMQKKIISMELDCEKNSMVSIGNMGRKIVLKNTGESKVKIETTIWFAEGFDDKALNPAKVLNIFLEKKKDEVQLGRTGTSTDSVRNFVSSRSALLKDPGPYIVNNKSVLTIYVPAEARLSIESRYNDVTIMDNVIAVKLDLIHTNLLMQDAHNAIIKSKYGTVKAGAIREADIDLVNCNFVSGNLEKLQINSKYSTIRFESSEAAEIKSVSDQYKIANANYITANKLFGKLDIAKLKNSIVLTGSSADIDIGAIEPSVKLIQVDNKYAEIKLPVEKLPNYHLQFDGINSNISPPFENSKETVPDSSIKASPAFNKTVGDMKKDFTSLVVNCASCMVDFR